MDIITMAAWIMCLIAAGMGVGLFLFIRAFPYKIRIREQTASNVELIHDKLAKIKKDIDGVEYLNLFGSVGLLKKIPSPPPSAISYDPKKKKKIVEATYSDDEGITFLEPPNEKLRGFQPLTTKQRQMMVNQIYKKESRKVTKWSEHIPLIVGLSAIVMLVVCILVFWGNFMEPMTQASGTAVNAIEKADHLIQTVSAWERGEQVIKAVSPP